MKKENTFFKKKIFLPILISALLLLTAVYFSNNFFKEKNSEVYSAPQSGQEQAQSLCGPVCHECKKSKDFFADIYKDGMNEIIANTLTDFVKDVTKCVDDFLNNPANQCDSWQCKENGNNRGTLHISIKPIKKGGGELPPCDEKCSGKFQFNVTKESTYGLTCDAHIADAYQKAWEEINKKIEEQCGKPECGNCGAGSISIEEAAQACYSNKGKVTLKGKIECSQKGGGGSSNQVIRLTVEQKPCILCKPDSSSGDPRE